MHNQMTKYILGFFLFALASTVSFAQVNQKTQEFPDRAAAGDLARSSALETFKADFNPQPSGILHVYIDPSIDPSGVYLFEGRKASGTTLALLPAKFQQMARRMNAKVYATAAIDGDDDSEYFLVRMDGTYEDRIEMFYIDGFKVKHVKTLATRACSNGKCTQTDTWITDIDGDTTPELIQINRVMRSDGNSKTKRTVYTRTNGEKWKKSKLLAENAPWDTVEFYEEN